MDLSKVDLNLLTVFHTIYETRSVSAAARQLDLSQPGMSHALRRLREQLGDKLFVRRGNGVEPTVYADRIAAPIRRAMLALQEDLSIESDFNPKTATRHFKLMIMDWSEDFIVPPLIRETAGNPDLTFELVSPRSEPIMEVLLHGSADLVFHLAPEMMHEIAFELVHETDLCLIHDPGHPIERSDKKLIDFLSMSKASLNLRAGAVMNLTKVNMSNKEGPHSVLYHSLRSAPGLVKGTGLIAMVPVTFAEYIAPIYGLSITMLPKNFFVQKMYFSWHRKFEHDSAHRWLRHAARESFSTFADQGN
ncbi:LysR family transcriptional regulator [Pacificoceanicola onchidii]|uniref:LysR family transcriptional regulator n=1 Tax=Pacificoceanicola onchidii TaxID=2562685 RepID=UPI0010A3813A|nr:LysR family transcriptional regulator [Pacificoceanicola onchidii]